MFALIETKGATHIAIYIPGLKTGAKREAVRVRLSDEEKAEIARCLLITGESESDFIRGAIAMRCKKTR